MKHSINILVCTHQDGFIYHSEILRPIIVGAANLGEEADKLQLNLESSISKISIGGGLNNGDSTQVFRDDTGDNISHLNPYFCELTAMYWAWKNLDSAYYGLFHYRRVLDLSGRRKKYKDKSPYPLRYNIKYPNRNFGFSNKNITNLIGKYDMILPHLYHDHNHISEPETMSVYDIYANYHYKQDLDSAIAYIKEKYPYMQNALESSLYSKPARWHIANMFVMKKELFFAYCEWIFDVLFAIEKKIDYKQYNPYQARVFGFLAERLFNVWITYKKEQENLKIFYAPIVVFVKKKPFIGWDINSSYKRFYLFGIRVYKGKL